MIVVRGPWRIYDVDLIGLGVIALLAIGAYYGAWVPHRAHARAHAELFTAAQQTEAQVLADRRRLQVIQSQIAELKAALGEQAGTVPSITELSETVNAVFTDAQATGLHVSSVKPSEPVAANKYLACDLEVDARGRVEELIAFLEQLARQRPYHSVESYSLFRDRTATDGECVITLALRVFFSDDSPSPAAEDSP